MVKNIAKVVLDMVALVLLTLLYRSDTLGLWFHEWFGLALMALLAVHLGLSWKWIGRVTGKLFSKETRALDRVKYLVGVLLLADFALIAVSGIMISRIAFPSDGQSYGWQVVHTFCAGLSLVLMGVHAGLNWDFVKGLFGKALELPAKLGKALGVAFLALVLAFGVFSIFTSNFTTMLASPFS
ncbi:MAG: DUF4405 domain-containing protein, partial [Propionibacteriaceae bacterium]|nr:DUF4405 domain-containing protein [Propionibacteriaceae bacterium]